MLVPGAIITILAITFLGFVALLAARQRGRRVIDAMTLEPKVLDAPEPAPPAPARRADETGRVMSVARRKAEERAWQVAKQLAEQRAKEEAERRLFQVAQQMAERRAWQVARDLAKHDRPQASPDPRN